MQVKHCIVCDSDEIKVKKGFEDHKLMSCDSCSMVFAWDIPERQELSAHYEQYGRDDYRSPLTVKRYKEVLSHFEAERSTNNILDIGCGLGFFLESAKELNWNVYGTEFTDTAIEKCTQHGIKMFKGDLSEVDFGSIKFDVITCFEVIEHIQDVKGFINEIRKILRPDGLLYLTTPNIQSFNSRLLKQDWNVLSYPEHLSYFSKKSLNTLLNDKSFEKIFLVSEGISPERLISSRKKKSVDHSSGQNKDEKLRSQVEKSVVLQVLKRSVNSMLNSLNLGESLKGLYRFKHDDRTPA